MNNADWINKVTKVLSIPCDYHEDANYANQEMYQIKACIKHKYTWV